MKYIWVTLLSLLLVSIARAALTPFKFGDDQQYFQFYGSIDRGFLLYNDGPMTLGYFPIDNNNAQSRFGFLAFKRQNDLNLGLNLEEAWDPYTTATANQSNRDVDWDRFDLRHAEIFVGSKAWGKIWAGKGSTASDGTAENDLSGTALAGYVAMGEASGQILRQKNGTLSNVKVKDAFSDYDGLGRQIRLRYDSPSLAGFVLSASWGKGDTPTPVGETETDKNMLWDVALTFAQTLQDFQISAGIAYSETSFTLKMEDGSFSILHLPSGFSLTMAAAHSDQQAQSLNIKYIYGKLGYQQPWFQMGKTYFSADAYDGDDLVVTGSQSRTYGFQAAQDITNWNTKFYLGYRQFQYKDFRAEYEASSSLLIGARFQF